MNDREWWWLHRFAGLGSDIDGSPMRWDKGGGGPADELASGDEDKAISLHFGNVARRGLNFSFL